MAAPVPVRACSTPLVWSYPVANEPGSFCWFECGTNDLNSAKAFYSKLFGWGVKEVPTGFYTEFQVGGRSIAGMMAIPQEQQEHVPDNWLPYALIDDYDATVDTASGLGATVVVPAQDIPNVGRFAVFADPAGAHLAVIKLDAHG